MPIVDPGWCWARSPSAPTAAFASARRSRRAPATPREAGQGGGHRRHGHRRPAVSGSDGAGRRARQPVRGRVRRVRSARCPRVLAEVREDVLADLWSGERFAAAAGPPRRPGHLRGRRRGRASRSGWPAPGPTAAVAARRRWDGVVAAWPSPQGPGSAWSPTKWRSWPKSAVAGPPPGRSTGRGQPRPADAPSVAADTAGRPATCWPAGWRSCAGPSGPARPPR
jgi:hypothetical protein